MRDEKLFYWIVDVMLPPFCKTKFQSEGQI